MKMKALAVAISTALIISGCASMGKEDRIGKNDGNDPCFVNLNRLDEAAIYYNDDHTKTVTTGVLVGAGTGLLLGLASGGSTGALIAGGVGGAIAGGFAADAYWSNKMRQANNQMDVAMQSMEADLQQDIGRLTAIDNDIAALLRCRIGQRDLIRQKYAEKKLTAQQAEQEWKKWGDLVRKDREEMKYLGDALNNISKIEQSYDAAATAISSTYPNSNVTPPANNGVPQQSLPVEIPDASYLVNGSKKQKAKKVSKRKQPVAQANTSSQNVAKQTTSTAPASKASSLKLLVASVHEKHESIQKNKAQIDKLAAEANNSKGFEQISSQAFPIMLGSIVPVEYALSAGLFLKENERY